MNRIWNLQAELDSRDFRRNGTSNNPGVNRYGRFAAARNNMLRQRGYMAVQNYTNDDDILMSKSQLKRFESLSGQNKRDYAQKLYEGNAVG